MNKYLITEFQELGVSEASAVLALQVYSELCEVKRYWNVTYEYQSQLEKIIIKGKKKASDQDSVFVPIPSYEELSFLKLQEFIDCCSVDSVFVAIVHPDSTCVYYQVAKDLLEPTELQAKHLRVNRQEKLDSELRKHRKTIEHAALLGLPITIVNKDIKQARSNVDGAQASSSTNTS